MRLRRLGSADYRAMSWRNGAGSTTEIAAAPEGAGIADFDWRVSIAEVTGPVEFSPFPGCDRIITVIEGEGMAIRLGGRDHRLEPLMPFPFAGEETVRTTLLGGETHAFNLMLRRVRAAGRVDVLRPGIEGLVLPAHHGTALLYGVAGAAELVLDSEAASFAAEETLIADRPVAGRLIGRTSPSATVLLVRLTERS
jgi:environmental stress-induced protein Ves